MLKIKELTYYDNFKDAEFIPHHPWNKLINGKPRGKSPIHSAWPTKRYQQNKKQILQWSNAGYNLGYRIGEKELVIDLDPRNYTAQINSEALLAELFGFYDFDDLLWELPVVKSGGGGYHIYCTLPDAINFKEIKKCTPELPGVDFKKRGVCIIAAGSRHPSGNYYYWENQAPRRDIPQKLIELIKRESAPATPYTAGYGALTGTQLQEWVLDKLDVSEYNLNETWEPLLMSAHHATGGEGIEEFLNWSLADSKFASDSQIIRERWESLDNSNTVSRTAATLIYELKKQGEDLSAIHAALESDARLDFAELEEEGEDSSILNAAKRAADQIDVAAITQTSKDEAGAPGGAIQAANDLSISASIEDKMKCMRLIKAASLEESIEAQEVLIKRKIMNQAAINKRLKALTAKMLDSVAEVLSNTSINSLFKRGKHIITEPNGQLWVFHKTHWKPVADEYLGKIVYGVLDTLKTKIEIEASEVTLVQNAVRTIRMRSSTLTTKLFNVEKDPLPIINCTNGEVWINADGTHTLKAHSYRSYQMRCLNANYDPSAKPSLFLKTLNEIFSQYPDCADIVNYLGEVMGYIIQPYKPDANWWMLRGPGGDGKSTIIKVIDAILGDALYSADEGLLSCGNGRVNAHMTADLVGKLAVVIQELEAGRVLNDSGLKMLSENTKMTANPKNKGTFKFRYIGTLLMCSNFYPCIKDTSEGTMRRANVIPFNRQFKKNNQADYNRARKILNNKEELAGVLNFLLEGFQRYVKRGHFDPPKSCVDAKNKWLNEANNIIRFAKESIIPGGITDKMGVASLVYARYERWCSLSGVKIKGRNNFYLDLQNLGFTKKVGAKNKLYLFGGVLRDELIDDFDAF